jgi:hypothetical protein
LRTVSFWGSSDDLFIYEVREDGKLIEEDEIDERDVIRIYDKQGNGLQVFARYGIGKGACWGVGFSQMDDDQPFPSWNITYKMANNAYSVYATVSIPDDAFIEIVRK